MRREREGVKSLVQVLVFSRQGERFHQQRDAAQCSHLFNGQLHFTLLRAKGKLSMMF